MKILMVSTDRKILEKDSSVRKRMIEYGNLVEEMEIIIFNLSKDASTKKNLEIKIPNTNVILHPTNSRNRWFYVFDAIRIGDRVVKNWKSKTGNSTNQSDVLISCQDPFETGFVGWIIKRKNKVKLQLQIHTDFLSKYFYQESFLNKVRVFLAGFLLLKADSIRVVSERIKRSLSQYGLKIDPIVLPIFVDIKKIKKSSPTKTGSKKFDFVFLIVSRLEEEKNVDLVIKAFSQVVKKYPKAGLIVVGDGTKRGELENLVKDLGLNNKVVFRGWQKEISVYYKNADLFLQASSYEGFGISLIEAASLGCPVLTSDVGIVGEILDGGNSFICDVKDENCFVNKMILAIENKAKLIEKSQIAQKMVELKLGQSKEDYLERFKESLG